MIIYELSQGSIPMRLGS